MLDNIQSVSKVSLNHGDILVLKSQHVLTERAVAHIRQSIREVVPESVKCLIFEEGMDFGVIQAAIVKCASCGGFAARNTDCVHCGAPVE